MRVESNFISIKRKTLSYFVIVVLTLGTVTPVLAYYLGPDRATTTSEVDTYDYGVWARDNNKAPYCLDKNGNKADDCIVCEWKRKPGNACGDATYSYTLGTKSEVVEKTINLDPATISSSLQNCNSNNGWCNTLPTLTLNGSEPLSGYNILAVEGSLNGQAFACSGSACDVPLNEGNNDFTFWALSSYGDSSQMGTLFAKVDTVSPNVGLDVVGSNGTSNWYVSSTTITATGSDSTSGLSSVLLSVNGGAWTASTTLNDGVYLVEVRAEDNAGNVSTSSTTISVDAVTPSISLNVNGTMGGNGWYSSNMQVTASASDLTSGIASLEVSTDGGVYQAYTSPVSLTDGYHTIRFKATDNAGNQTETPIQEFYVDAMAPEIDIPSSWEVNKTIGYNIQDDGSGLAALRIVIEDEDEKYKKIAWDEEVSGGKFKGEITWNGKFKDGTVAPPGEYLVWIKAKDMAGNERFGLGRVVVPQPTVFSLLQPTTTNNQETLLPPQELFDGDELPITNPSATTTPQQNLSFGESITDPKESTQTSLSLANGTASASTTTNSNILWSATAAALIGWATATALEEKKKRKALHRASRDEAEQVKARASRDEEPPMTRQEKELAQQRKELQKIWDANGAAIYEANREYQAKHGKEMDAATRSKAIKDATMNGVFHAGAYASNLETEKARWDAQNERMANKMTRFEKEEETRWQASQKAAEEKRKAEELQAGYAAYYAAMRQGEQEAQSNWWDKAVDFAQENIVEPIQKTWNTVTTFVQDKIVEPVVIVLDERVYQPYIKPAAEKIKEVVKESAKWINEHVYQPYIKPVVDTVKNNANMAMETVQNGWASLFSLFQTHPTAAWATAGTVTLAAIAGTTYYLNCLGQPIFTPPAVSLFNLASIGALPVAGVLTTGKKKRFHGIVIGMVLLGMLLSACGTGNVPSVPTTTPTLCPSTETPTTIPSTVIATPEWMNPTPTSIETNLQLYQLQAWLAANGLPSDWESVYRWQNQFDAIILQIAMDRNIPPMLLKALFGHEGQFVPIPDNSIRGDALGMGQILPSGIDTVFNFGEPTITQKWLEMNYALVVGSGDANKMVDIYGQPIYPAGFKDYRAFYQQLSPDAKTLFRGYFLGFINNKCDYREAANGQCVEGGVSMPEVSVNFEFGADVLMAGDNAISQYMLANNRSQLWNTFWNNLPEEEKWKVRVATYNSGQGCIGDAIIATGGQASNWTDIAEQLGSGCTQGADEVNGVWNILK